MVLTIADVRNAGLVAVAETLAESQVVAHQVRAVVPETTDRLVIAEDPLLGVGFQVIQSPQSLDATAGLSVIYLGGTTRSPDNWQARAIGRLSDEPCVIANPRREQPPIDHEDVLDQLAWQHRHLWDADIALFWFDGTGTDPVDVLEFGIMVGNTVKMAIGVSPDDPDRHRLCAYIRHCMPDKQIYDSLDDAVTDAITAIERQDRPRFRLPRHDVSQEASALRIQFAIARTRDGNPGIGMLLRELLIEAGCAAGHGVEPHLIAKIYIGVERLQHDTDDPLGWTQILDVCHALSAYTGFDDLE